MTNSNHHLKQFGCIFEEKKKTKCCRMINQHKRKGLKVISLDTAVNLKQKEHKVIPGHKFCCQYINQYEKMMKEPEEIVIDENETETEEILQTKEDVVVKYEELPRKKLNTSLESDGVSPVFMLYHSKVE